MAETIPQLNVATDSKAERKLLMVYADVAAPDSETATWEIIGRGIEDMSMEFGHDTNQIVDVLGISDIDVSPAKPNLGIDPNNLRGGNKLAALILDCERKNNIARMQHIDILVIHAYVGSTSFEAEIHKNCTVVPQSLGGSSYVGMPLQVMLSNNKTLGTATVSGGTPTFTEAD